MKETSITVRLDAQLRKRLDRVCRESGRSRSEVIRDALTRQLALARLDQARRQIMPFAEARGYLTDDDVFRDVS